MLKEKVAQTKDKVVKRAKKSPIKSSIVAGLIVTAASFYGAIDWKPVKELPVDHPIYVAAESLGVGYQDSPEGSTSRCNYFAVGEDLVLTNGHCYNKDYSETRIQFFNRVDFVMCPEVLATAPFGSFDYTLLRCKGELPRPIKINPRPLVLGEPLIHLQVNCNYRENSQCKVEFLYDASADCKVTDIEYSGGQMVKHTCDSQSGSSGSFITSFTPNTDGELEVVLLFNSDHYYPDARGEKGYGAFSAAVKMEYVIADLQRKGFDLMKAQTENKDTGKVAPVVEIKKESTISSGSNSLWLIIISIFAGITAAFTALTYLKKD